MNPRVLKVAPLDEHHLQITFTNGEQRIFDATPYLGYPAFRKRAIPEYFSLAKPDHGTVCWPDDVDFCPDTLYVESV